jgi:transposase InsO family protein
MSEESFHSQNIVMSPTTDSLLATQDWSAFLKLLEFTPEENASLLLVVKAAGLTWDYFKRQLIDEPTVIKSLWDEIVLEGIDTQLWSALKTRINIFARMIMLDKKMMKLNSSSPSGLTGEFKDLRISKTEKKTKTTTDDEDKGDESDVAAAPRKLFSGDEDDTGDCRGEENSSGDEKEPRQSLVLMEPWMQQADVEKVTQAKETLKWVPRRFRGDRRHWLEFKIWMKNSFKFFGVKEDERKVMFLTTHLEDAASTALLNIMQKIEQEKKQPTFRRIVRRLDDRYPEIGTEHSLATELEALEIRDTQSWDEFFDAWSAKYDQFSLRSGGWTTKEQIRRFLNACGHPELLSRKTKSLQETLRLLNEEFPRKKKKKPKMEDNKGGKGDKGADKGGDNGNKDPRQKGDKGKSKNCFLCNQEGHFSYDCPQKGNTAMMTLSGPSSRSMMKGIVTAADGSQVESLVKHDTASTHTFVDRKFFIEKMGGKLEDLQPCHIEFVTLNGVKVCRNRLDDFELRLPQGIFSGSVLVDDVPFYDVLLEETYDDKLRTHSSLDGVLSTCVGLSKFEVEEAIDKLLATSEIPEGVDASMISNRLKGFWRVFDEDLSAGISEHIVRLPLKPDAVPVRHPPRRMSPLELKELRKFRDDNLKAGIIQRCHGGSLWNHRIVFKHEENKIRVCGDLRDVNNSSEWLYYPVPNIEDILPVLAGKVYCVLDLKRGFWQLRVDERDRSQLAFTVDGVLYEYCRVPFGHKNSAGLFQKTIQDILGELLFTCVILYIDDLVIYATTWEDLIEALFLVLEKFRRFNVKVALSKVQLFRTKIEYLGYTVTATHYHPGRKIKALLRIKKPSTIKELRSYVAMSQFYRKNIPKLSIWMKPLHGLTKKNASMLEWGQVHDLAFRRCQLAIANFTNNRFIEEGDTVFVMTDASNEGIAGGLFVVVENGPEPAYSVSRGLKAHEIKYWTTEKEALAIKFALTKMRAFLHGKFFIVYTDHLPLVSMMGRNRKLQVENKRIEAFNADLESFDFEVHYRKGSNNGFADFFSRYTLQEESMLEKAEDEQLTNDELEQLEGCQLEGCRKIDWNQGRDDDDDSPPDVCMITLDSVEEDIVPRVIWYKYHQQEGHCGIARALKYLKEAYPDQQWNYKQIKGYTVQCYCQRMKALQRVGEENYEHETPDYYSSEYLEMVCMDTVAIGEVFFLNMKDLCSRRSWIIRLTHHDSAVVCSALDHWSLEYGLPWSVLVDNGSEFIGMAAGWLRQHGIHVVKSSRYNPRANGCIERNNRSFLEAARMFKLDNPQVDLENNWDECLPKIVDFLNRNVMEVQGNGYPGLREGSLVYVYFPRRGKLDENWQGPYIIVRELLNGKSLLVEDLEGNRFTTLRKHLKSYERFQEPGMCFKTEDVRRLLDEVKEYQINRFFNGGDEYKYGDLVSGSMVFAPERMEELVNDLREWEIKENEGVVAIVVPYWPEQAFHAVLTSNSWLFKWIHFKERFRMVLSGENIGLLDSFLDVLIFKKNSRITRKGGRCVERQEIPQGGEAENSSVQPQEGEGVGVSEIPRRRSKRLRGENAEEVLEQVQPMVRRARVAMRMEV